jgi:DNA-binding IclR family transcriptional regulator
MTLAVPDMAMAILGALVELGKPASLSEIIAASGYEYGSFYRAAGPIMRHGWMRKPFNGRYEITERGKIALAIEIGRRTKARSLGYGRRPTFSNFERRGLEAVE